MLGSYILYELSELAEEILSNKGKESLEDITGRLTEFFEDIVIGFDDEPFEEFVETRYRFTFKTNPHPELHSLVYSVIGRDRIEAENSLARIGLDESERYELELISIEEIV